MLRPCGSPKIDIERGDLRMGCKPDRQPRRENAGKSWAINGESWGRERQRLQIQEAQLESKLHGIEREKSHKNNIKEGF